MLYKDLANRCVIDFQNLQSNGNVGKEGSNYEEDVDQETQDLKQNNNKVKDRYAKRDEDITAKQKKLLPSKKKKAAKVFYFKPETFMMADPDTQRLYREQLINRIKQPPQLSKPRLLAQDLQKQLIDTVADRSNPSQMRQLLADYFKRKQYCLQHKRYKLLIRWAHHAIRTRNIDSLSQQATFRCSKLQWDIDNSIKRAQRLSEEDDYLLGMHDNLRPSSKSDQNDGTLYLEIKDLPPHSSIREDDIEVYLRHVTYAEKINKLLNKWLARLKWMPLTKRFEIFDQMVDKYFQIREKNLESQFEFWQRTEKHTRSINIETPELLDEIKQLKDESHILNYKKQIYSVKQKTLGACRPDYDIVPDLINNNPEIKMKVKDMAKMFGLTADLDQDEGFSFGYQLTLFFPTQFQMLVLRSTFSIYDAFAGQSDELTMKKQRNTQSSVRVDPNLFKDVSTNQNLIPNEESLTSESQRQNIKIIRLKTASWLQYVNVFPIIPDWQRRQDAILASEDNPIDHLLQGTMDFLDVNDLASVNIIIAEASQMHVEIVKKLKILNEQQKDSKLKMQVQVPSGFQQKNEQQKNEDNQNDNQDIAVEQEVYQTVSATSIKELNNSMYQHMSNCLTGANLLEKIYREREAKEKAEILNQKLKTKVEMNKTQKQLLHRTSLLNIQQNLVQSHSILRYMNSRQAKTNILYCLNYFRSIQKRLMIDLREFGSRERMLGDVVDPFIAPEEADINLVDTYNMIVANTNKDMKDIIDGNKDKIQESQMSGPQKIQRNINKRQNQQIDKLKKTKEQELQNIIQDKLNSEKLNTQNSGKSVENLLEAQYELIKTSDMNYKQFNNIDLPLSISLVDIKKLRLKKQFQERHLSTCPVLPRFHATFGEPSEIQPEFVQNDVSQKEILISRECMKFLNRVDHIEINEKSFEVLVKDDFNIYIMYECSITDMQILEQEILRIGSYYISKLEELYDTEVDKISHKKDRQQVLNDLLNCEMEFQFKKVQLSDLYMEAYEQICDPVDQQRLTKIIVDLMARRPRLSLENFNFKDSYKAELHCLDKQIELLDLIIQNQMKIEKEANTNLHESLNLSYMLAQLKERDQWEYSNTDDFIKHLVEKFVKNEKLSQFDDDIRKQEEIQKIEDTAQKWNQVEQQVKQEMKINEISSPKKKEKQQKKNVLNDIRYNDEELNGDAFTEILGLPKVTIENLFNQKSENDDIIKDIMDEQSHFVNLIEGYPDLMSMKFSGKSQKLSKNKELSKNKISQSKFENQDSSLEYKSEQKQKEDFNINNVNSSLPEQIHELNMKFSNFQQRQVQMSIMDFYSDAFSPLPKIHATFVNCFNELSDVLCPHDNTMSSLLEAEIYQQAIYQFRQMKQFLIGEKTEYQGHQYVEDELIVGSSDKLMFYMKDFYTSLQKQMKINQNPFLIAKLDTSTIKSFTFPQNMAKQKNPYILKKANIKEGLEVSLNIAINMFFIDPEQFSKNYVKPVLNEKKMNQNQKNIMHFGQSQSQNLATMESGVKAIKVPNLLHLTCNIIEMLRLRHELILCITECIELQNVFINQVQTCNSPTLKPLYSEGLAFEHELLGPGELNFMDDGPASMLNIELAINECDPILASNLNFRNPDAIKIMMTKSGLEELRVILHYQIMQKQALIVSTRTNQTLIDIHMKAAAELQIARRNQGIPNTVIQLEKLFSRFSDDIDEFNFTKVKRLFTTNLTDCVQPIIVPVNHWKSQQRTNLGKKFQEAVAFCEKEFQVKEVKLRLLRSFKVSLINKYCNHVLEKVYADSIKFNIVSQCQKLRNINQYFHFNPQSMNIQTQQSNTNEKIDNNIDKIFTFSQLFNLETNSLIENGYDWYQYGKYVTQFESYVKTLQNNKQQTSEINSSSSNNFVLSKIETIDVKKKQLLDIFSIPSSSSLMQLEIFSSQEEKQKYQRQSLELFKYEFKDPEEERKKYLKHTLEQFGFDFMDPNVECHLLYYLIQPSVQDLYPVNIKAKKYTKIQIQTLEQNKREKLLDYNQLQIVEIFNYYTYIENIINLELSISKFSLNSQICSEMDNCIQNGIPFFQQRDAQYNTGEQEELCSNDLLSIMNSGKPTQNILNTQKGKKLIQDQEKLKDHPQKRNIYAAKILNIIYHKKRMKSDVGEELYYVSLRLKDLFNEAKIYGEKIGQGSFSNDYLALYQEIRYMQIISTISKMSEHFYTKRQVRAGKILGDTLLTMSKRDHVQVVLSNGAAHVNTSDIDSHKINIDSNSLVNYFGDYYESINFKKTIFPILSDKSLEPQEITLLETIYLNNSDQDFQLSQANVKNKSSSEIDQNKFKEKKTFSISKFTGGGVLTKPFSGSELQAFQTNLLCLDNSQRLYINSNLKQMDSLLEDYLQHIVSEFINEGVYNRNSKILSYSQLFKSIRFLTDQIEAKQLKNAILCFLGHDIPSKLMLNTEQMERIDNIFKKDLLWKIMQEKDLQRIAQDAKYNSRIQDEQYQQLKKDIEDEIIKLQKIIERKITSEEIKNHQRLKIKALEEEHNIMRKNVLLDSILYNRAQVVVIQQEIERCLIKASVQTLDSECVALANCLKIQSNEINAYIHPFQQFAVTLYDKIDKNSHLDPINKCSHLQVFLTRLKNRGTEVETLTSGPGYVFTLKDINDCVGSLANGLLKFSEHELRSRCEFFAKKEQHYLNQLYNKDQQIEYLEYRVKLQTENIDKLVNARMYEKGNKLVYELDQSNRSLKLLKDNYNLMERNLYREIETQFKNNLNKTELLLFNETKKFEKLRIEYTSILKQTFAEHKEEIQKDLKKLATDFQEKEQSPAKFLIPRPGQFEKQNIMQKYKMNNLQNQDEQTQNLKMVQYMNENDKQYDYVNEPGKPYDFPTQIKDQFKLSEQEAYTELSLLIGKTRLMFVFWKFKEVIMKQKFNEQLLVLSQKVSSNVMLWEQMAESEKRENILRQELVLSQQSLSNSEKMIEKQKEHIKKLETEVVRLQNFKQQKSKRLDELEKKVIQYEIIQKIDVDKLIFLLHKQQQEVESLKNDEKNFSNKLGTLAKKNNEDLKLLQQKYNQENQVKNEAILNVEQMRQEMKLLEVNNGSMTNVWKQKCEQLVQLVQQLQSENHMLKEKSQDLAKVSIKLLNTFNEIQQNNLKINEKIIIDSIINQQEISNSSILKESKKSALHFPNNNYDYQNSENPRYSRETVKKLMLPQVSSSTQKEQFNQSSNKNQSFDNYLQQLNQENEKIKRKVIIPSNHRRNQSLIQSLKQGENQVDSQNSLIQSNNSAYELRPRQDNNESTGNLLHKQNMKLLKNGKNSNEKLRLDVQGERLNGSQEFNKQILEKRMKNLQNLKRAISVSQQTQDIQIIDSQYHNPNIQNSPNRKNIIQGSNKRGFPGILGGYQQLIMQNSKDKNFSNLKLYTFGQYDINNDSTVTGKQISTFGLQNKQYPNNQKNDTKSFYNMKGLMGLPQLYKQASSNDNDIIIKEETIYKPKAIRDSLRENIFKKYSIEKSNESRISQERIENLSNVISQATTVLLKTQQSKNRNGKPWATQEMEESREVTKLNSYILSDQISNVKEVNEIDQMSPDEDAQFSQYQITPVTLAYRQIDSQLKESNI